MEDEAKTSADSLERALRQHEAKKRATADIAAQRTAEAARLGALQAQVDALPQRERRTVPDAAGLRQRSAPPPPEKRVRGGGFVASSSLKAVRWPAWLALPHVELWQAVALSLGVEPADELRDDVSRAPSRFSRLPVEFFERQSHCKNALSFDGPIRPQGNLYRGMLQSPWCKVLMADVAAFLTLAGYGMPEEMRVPAAPVVRSPSAAEPVCALLAASEAHIVRRRADPLAAVLKLAEREALDSDDWQSVWAALIARALPATRPAPLLGYVEGEGVQYRADDPDAPTAYLTRDAFRKRFKRKG